MVIFLDGSILVKRIDFLKILFMLLRIPADFRFFAYRLFLPVVDFLFISLSPL